jgi:hypothetical protein
METQEIISLLKYLKLQIVKSENKIKKIEEKNKIINK